jgi:hypothetical protein
LLKINQRNFWPVLIKDFEVYWIHFLTVPIRLSIFYHGRFAFFVWKTVFLASAAHKVVKTLLSIEFCSLRVVSHSNIVKTDENRELVLFEKTLDYLDRNGSKRNQKVWEFSFNLIWTLSIIAIMDSVHDTLKASIKP